MKRVFLNADQVLEAIGRYAANATGVQWGKGSTYDVRLVMHGKDGSGNVTAHVVITEPANDPTGS